MTNPAEKFTDASAHTNPYLGLLVDGRYRVEDVIGEGGMGIVFRVRHVRLESDLAMKVCRVRFQGNPRALAQFEEEARIAARIESPHVVGVRDFGLLGCGSLYSVMEFVDGISLARHLSPGRALPVERAAFYARQICDGLAAVHNAGIVHRDLKPGNVMLSARDGRELVRIIDFGIAHALELTDEIRRSHRIVGTPVYMAPEQCLGRVVDTRADIYSLGVMLFEMTTGRVPFDAPSVVDIMARQMNEPPPRPSTLNPEIPRALDETILACLEKSPKNRVQSATKLAARLDEHTRSRAISFVRAKARRPSDVAETLDAYGDTALETLSAVSRVEVRKRLA
ncbi:MAG: serine/threonine-protein kinase [Polyangiales bacterium]